MERFQIPRPVITIVADELANHHTHAKLDILFIEHGAPGEPPIGSKVTKCDAWLRAANADPSVDTAKLLGGILEDFMEVDRAEVTPGDQEKRRERVRTVLAKYGLQYRAGGMVLGGSTGAPTRSLESTLRARDMASVEIEFERALAAVEIDPPASITAASAILEALCKVYIQDEALEFPKDQTLKPLWAILQKHLGLDPASIEDDDIRRILSGMLSAVDGIGALRTHAGSAHGRGRKPYRLRGRHARLAIHAAHTLALFALETWDERKREKK